MFLLSNSLNQVSPKFNNTKVSSFTVFQTVWSTGTYTANNNALCRRRSTTRDYRDRMQKVNTEGTYSLFIGIIYYFCLCTSKDNE